MQINPHLLSRIERKITLPGRPREFVLAHHERNEPHCWDWFGSFHDGNRPHPIITFEHQSYNVARVLFEHLRMERPLLPNERLERLPSCPSKRCVNPHHRSLRTHLTLPTSYSEEVHALRSMMVSDYNAGIAYDRSAYDLHTDDEVEVVLSRSPLLRKWSQS